jgi:hypothetical protein
MQGQQTMKTKHKLNLLAAALAAASLALPAFAEDKPVVTDAGELNPEIAAKAFPKPPYSPYVGRNFPTRPLWGDTHLHTSVSFDAVGFGCHLGPEDAYRFARGEEVTSSTGVCPPSSARRSISSWCLTTRNPSA